MQFSLTKGTSNCIKILAAIMVMFHHYAQYLKTEQSNDSILVLLFASYAGYVGVALFFFLSGYGLMESELNSHLNSLCFFRRRLLKVYLPVIAVTVVWAVFFSFLIYENPFDYSCEYLWGGVIISILRFDFGDGILWFIKVLIILYCSFFIFSVIRQRSSITGFVFLFLCALLLTYAGCFKGYMSYSIPMFYVGIVLSVSKKIGYNAVVLSIGLLTLNLLIGLAIFGRLIPLIVVTLVIASLIITFSSIKIDISIPAFLAAMSFDLYLVHYKVLWSLKSNIDYVPFIYYIAIAVITTVSFYLFRTKLLRLK